MPSAARVASEVFDEKQSSEIEYLSHRVFGRKPDRVAFPGGTSRSAFIVDMAGELYVFARRESKSDAQLEGIVLRAIGNTGHVPKLKAVEKDWVVQEFISGVRLPVVLNDTSSMDERERHVDAALNSLAHIHNAASATNLQHRVPKVGTVDYWLWDRTGAAKRMSKTAEIDIPDLDRDKLVKLMDVKRDEFVKWDARPGNAMVDGKRVVWFDWEDCGRSKALDDLAFVLCDEWMCLDEDAENRLLKTYFPFFNRSLSTQHGEHYLRLFAVTHMVLRLRMAQKLWTRKNKWWDRAYCLEADKVGATEQEFGRTLARAKRWSDGVEEWKPLLPWLDELSEIYL